VASHMSYKRVTVVVPWAYPFCSIQTVDMDSPPRRIRMSLEMRILLKRRRGLPVRLQWQRGLNWGDEEE